MPNHQLTDNNRYHLGNLLSGKKYFFKLILVLLVGYCFHLGLGFHSVIAKQATSKSAARLHIAVASNFASTLVQLIRRYQQGTNSNIQITTSVASTGKLVNQIRHGAPYDLLLAADTSRPQWLVAQGYVPSQSVQVFTRGQLLLVIRAKANQQATQATQLEAEVKPETAALHLPSLAGKQLAIANPETAPYGSSALHWLTQQDYQSLSIKLLTAENILQAWQYFALGGADAAVVAKSIVINLPRHEQLKYQSFALDTLDTELLQGALIVRPSVAAEDFLAFLLSPAAQQLIIENGYAPISSSTSINSQPLKKTN